LKSIKVIFHVIVLLVLSWGCAKMGSLTGGYEDIDPPVVVRSMPLNYSTNFNAEKIEIEFDEYIALKNVAQELIISPPLPKKPVVRIKNKSIIIELKNELIENTTYTLNFGKAIEDNNEGNPLTNFEFVFSTGKYLDSLSVKGTLINSFNLKPSKEPFIIGLYDQLEDSIPLKSIPVYVGKTNEKGYFMINNIKADTFRIFALKDLNMNLKFDLFNEEIAFIDTVLIITPEFLISLPERIEVIDSSSIDTVIQTRPPRKGFFGKVKDKEEDFDLLAEAYEDSTLTDTLQKKPVLPALFVDMVYFTEEITKQYMTSSDRISKVKLMLSFNLPLKNNPGVDIPDYEEDNNWYLPEINAKRDTFVYWLTDTTLIKRDSLIFVAAYPMLDSMGADYTKLDTLRFITRKALPKQTKGKTEVKIPEEKLTVSSLRNNGILDLNAMVPFVFNYPLESIDTSRIHLFLKIDSTETVQKFDIIHDSTSLKKIFLNSKWKEAAKYRLEALPGAFSDIYNHPMDTLIFNFSLQEKDYYGTLIVTLEGVDMPVIVQLMNDTEVVLRSKYANSDGAVIFDFLPAAKYKLKFINDSNVNKQWDTGNYLKKLQPEKVLYFKGDINVRSNWDFEVKQNMKE